MAAPSTDVIARLRPGDPVHRGPSIYLERLWNTGSPAFAEDDDWRMARPPYAVFSIGGADGRISANATWMMPPAKPSATPIRQAIL
jgi:hypothetical protein